MCYLPGGGQEAHRAEDPSWRTAEACRLQLRVCWKALDSIQASQSEDQKGRVCFPLSMQSASALAQDNKVNKLVKDIAVR